MNNSDKKIQSMEATKDCINSNSYSSHYSNIPTEKEIIDSYLYANNFFKQREKYHKNASIWYSNEAMNLLNKADQHEQKALISADNAYEYLQLAGMAIAKRGGLING